MNYGEIMKELKAMPETSYAFNPWTCEEDAKLIESIKTKEIDDIAKEHKRTRGGITSHLRVIAVRMINTDGKTIEEVSEILRMKPEDIKKTLQRSKAAKEKRQMLIPNETSIDILKEIRDILVRIESKMT
jgi:hypothetical protein